MQQVPIKLGPLAILLALISICLTMLSILTFTTAAADMRLAQKYASTVRTRYELERDGQALLAETHANGAGGQWTEEADGSLTTLLENEDMRLHIRIAGEDEDYRILTWRMDKEWDQDPFISNLWSGK